MLLDQLKTIFLPVWIAKGHHNRECTEQLNNYGLYSASCHHLLLVFTLNDLSLKKGWDYLNVILWNVTSEEVPENGLPFMVNVTKWRSMPQNWLLSAIFLLIRVELFLKAY